MPSVDWLTEWSLGCDTGAARSKASFTEVLLGRPALLLCGPSVPSPLSWTHYQATVC